MLFIFRKLRHSFFQPGKLRTYVAYAIGEIVLIVVGILLALQISESNQSRKDRIEETDILVRLKAEMEANQGQLQTLTENYKQIAQDMRAFLEMIEPEPETYPDELIFGYLISQRAVRSYIPSDGVINSILASGKMGLIQNDMLSDKLNSWPGQIDRINYLRDRIIAGLGKYPSHHQFFRRKDLNWNPSGTEDTGTSNFAFDQKELLSNPVLEDMVETKRWHSDLLVRNFENLQEEQQEILALIEQELAQR
jgi:hypothetical protein